VADLTGQLYPPTDRDTADAIAALPGIRVALTNYDADDVPDVTPRPLDELVSLGTECELRSVVQCPLQLAKQHRQLRVGDPVGRHDLGTVSLSHHRPPQRRRVEHST